MAEGGRPDGGRRTRPSPGLRRRTLGVEQPSAAAERKTLQAMLDAIPDLEASDGQARSTIPGDAEQPRAMPARPVRPTGPREAHLSAPSVPPMPGSARVKAADPSRSSDGADEAAGKGASTRSDRTSVDTSGPSRVPVWRRIAFAVVLLSLFAAIPVLGNEGRLLVWGSKGGRDATRHVAADDPGYVEEVQGTPTALIAQTDADGGLVALTLLALSSDTGGTIIFIPIRSELPEAQILLNNIDQKYEHFDRTISSLVVTVGDVLGVGIDEVDGVDDRGFQQLFAPVGSITITNPDPMVLSTGRELEAGEVTLAPTEIGPYLAHLAEDEDQLSQATRHQLVWQAWLAAVAEDPEGRVPGGGSGPGRFIEHLGRASGAGELRITSLPGAYGDKGIFVPERAAVTTLMVDAVPVPVPNRPDSRTVLQVLNGIEPGPPPPELVRKLVSLGGSIALVGNGPEFGADRTTFTYTDPALEGTARELAASLGLPDAEVNLDIALADKVDVTIVFAPDLLEAIEASDSTTGDP